MHTRNTFDRLCCLTLLLLLFGFVTACAAAQSAGSTAATPQKDVLVFNNGDQLSGTLEREVGGNVTFNSDMAGEITVPLAKVKELRTAGRFAVLQHGVPVRESERVVPSPIIITNDGVTISAGRGVESQPVPAAKVAYIVDADTFDKDLRQAPNFFRGWRGIINFGTTFVQSTTHGGTLNAGLNLARQVPVLTFFPPRNRTMLNFQETYGILTQPAVPVTNTPFSQTKTSILHAEGERDEYFSKKAYVLADATFDHNYAQGLQLQQVYGGGVGYTAFSTPRQQLDLKFQMQYEKQAFFSASGTPVRAEPDQNLIGSTFAENYRRSLPRKIMLTESVSVLPSWNVPNDYSANGNLGLAMPVFRRLSLSFNATDDFLNNPQPGFLKNSFQFTTGLTFAVH